MSTFSKLSIFIPVTIRISDLQPVTSTEVISEIIGVQHNLILKKLRHFINSPKGIFWGECFLDSDASIEMNREGFCEFAKFIERSSIAMMNTAPILKWFDAAESRNGYIRDRENYINRLGLRKSGVIVDNNDNNLPYLNNKFDIPQVYVDSESLSITIVPAYEVEVDFENYTYTSNEKYSYISFQETDVSSILKFADDVQEAMYMVMGPDDIEYELSTGALLVNESRNKVKMRTTSIRDKVDQVLSSLEERNGLYNMRDIYHKLGMSEQFHNWARRIINRNNFIPSVDYYIIVEKTVGRNRTDYAVSKDTARVILIEYINRFL